MALFSSLSAKSIVTTLIMSSTVASNSDAYAIGEPGKPWGIAEKKEWRDTRVKQRSYFEDVVPRVEKLKESGKDLFEVTQYGDLPHLKDNDTENAGDNEDSCKAEAFPLFAIRTRNWTKDKPNVLITGGVHGYETSGVEGALMFLERSAEGYSKHFNIVVAPCISPWGYERIQRWNAYAVDPNRSFNPDGEIVEGRSFNPEAATEESAALIKYLREDIKELAQNNWICHLDLHETTDTDETEFRPAKSARDGDTSEPGEIPDGFYLVQDETSMKPEWFTAMIERVRTVTHIAPSDADGNLIGEEISQEGVIKIPSNRLLGLCAGVTDAPYRTTTEVYPDSKNATPEECNRAQVACIEGALDYIVKHDLALGATAETATAVEQN
uniref:Peptidase M14 domain-containing protein n=1 Tax=Pseudo-nitzschia australis TaxID=44445 RepID=A0A7S4AJT2_9STRA|mmetsp:Transcript_26173/g.57315  ORF Transcript_26173/g.57315 Transcript_26173/m.57315 type:complete len:383 (-) Transcript_26173:186-1334(-)